MNHWMTRLLGHSLFRKLTWRLTLTYLLVTLAAVFMLAWWGLAATMLFLQRSNPALSWMEIIQTQVMPFLPTVLPGLLILLLPASLVSVYFGFLTARWLDMRLDALRKAVQEWRKGNFDVKVVDDSADEISAFGQDLNIMAGELEELLQNRTDLVIMKERNQLASDLHDSVKQQITAAAFQIAAARNLLNHDPSAVHHLLTEAENLTHSAHKELNAILFELHPQTPDNADLVQSLQRYTTAWSRQNPIRMSIRAHEQPDLPLAMQKDLLRFTQEALSNVARHSHAARVVVSLGSDDQNLIMMVEDDGCGFNIGEKTGCGYGLETMRARAERLGGQFILKSSLQGTQVGMRIPFEYKRCIDGNENQD